MVALGVAALIAWGIGSVAGSGGESEEHQGFAARLAKVGGTGPGSLSAVRTTEEAAAVKRVLAEHPLVTRGGGSGQMVALTFDDGPSEWTPQIVRILEREGVPATFFTVGGMYSTYSANAAAARELGFTIANHTWNHLQMTTLSAPEQSSELERTSDAIAGIGAPKPDLFRPPFGANNGGTNGIVRKHGMVVVLWDVDTLDWQRPGSESITANAVGQATAGSIVLMHDGGGDRSQTVAALPGIIKGLRAKGFRFVTVPRLLAEDPPVESATTPPSSAGDAPAAGAA